MSGPFQSIQSVIRGYLLHDSSTVLLSNNCTPTCHLPMDCISRIAGYQGTSVTPKQTLWLPASSKRHLNQKPLLPSPLFVSKGDASDSNGWRGHDQRRFTTEEGFVTVVGTCRRAQKGWARARPFDRDGSLEGKKGQLPAVSEAPFSSRLERSRGKSAKSPFLKGQKNHTKGSTPPSDGSTLLRVQPGCTETPANEKRGKKLFIAFYDDSGFTRCVALKIPQTVLLSMLC